MSQSVRKRKARSVDEKYHIIKRYERRLGERGLKSNLVREFELQQISTLDAILKKKNEIVAAFEANLNGERKRLKQSLLLILDQKLYDWFLTMRANKVELSGDLILEKARQLAEALNISNFGGSHGYLDGFKARFGVNFSKLHGQGGAVDEGTVSDWFGKLNEILQDYVVVEGQQDDDFCELAVPSAKEAFTALNTVRNFLLAEGLTEESFQLEKITRSVSRVAEEKLKQKTITDYFHVCI